MLHSGVHGLACRQIHVMFDPGSDQPCLLRIVVHLHRCVEVRGVIDNVKGPEYGLDVSEFRLVEIAPLRICLFADAVEIAEQGCILRNDIDVRAVGL